MSKFSAFLSIEDLSEELVMYITEKELTEFMLQKYYSDCKDAFDFAVALHTVEVRYGVKIEKDERSYMFRKDIQTSDLYTIKPHQWGVRDQFMFTSSTTWGWTLSGQEIEKDLKDEAEGDI